MRFFTCLFTNNNNFYTDFKVIVTRETISNIEVKLPKKEFIRVHRSYIVSIAKISLFTNEYIEISDKAIPNSGSYKKDVIFKLENV